MRTIAIVILVVLLAGCGGLPKAGPQAALYDFGISPADAPVTSLPVRLASVAPAPGLESSDMRYRLAYQNPARVLAYTESRWAAPPDRLFAQRLGHQLSVSGSAQCTLHVALETFDQVFETPDSSLGIVRLSATLSRAKSRDSTVQTSIATEQANSSADARGGVAALTAATDAAIKQLLAWAAETCSSLK